MFKHFTEKDVTNVMQIKGSIQKQIKAKIVEYYPEMEPYVDGIFPKKDPVKIAKCRDHIEILISGTGSPLFFKQREGAWFPTLRTLHQYPFMLAHDRVDGGAIKSILSGANVMCPGMNSKAASICNVPKNTIVAVMASGKEHAMGIGITTMTPEEIVRLNRGVCIEVVHFLNDGLWRVKTFK